MEPDKTYPIHTDDTSQSPAPVASPTNEQHNTLEVPSKYNQVPKPITTPSTAVPWYLRPLAKTTNSPLTSPQTRPFVSREPLSPTQQSYGQQNVSDAPDVQSAQPDNNEDNSRQVSQSINEPAQSPIESSAPVISPPLSPFRSRPMTPSSPQRWDKPSEPLSSADRFQMPNQSKAPEYKQALSASSLKPFSQFDARTTKQSNESGSPKSKPNSKKKIVVIGLTVLAVAAISVGALWMWRSVQTPSSTGTPVVVANAEERLYQAIENNMNVSNVHQLYEQTTVATLTSAVKIDAISDFSNPRAPKSHLKYEVRTGEGDSGAEAAGELMVESASEYYAKLTKPALFYNGDEKVGPKEGQWYAISSDDTRSEVLMDPLGARSSINTPLGEFPIGSFSEGTRQQLMQYIKDQKVYEIVSSRQVEIDGRKMTNYVLTFNTDALNDLNRKVFATIGGNVDDMPVEFTKSNKQRTEIWISDDTTRIAKIQIERESTPSSGGQVVQETIVVMYDYPDDVSKIKKPESVKTPTWNP